jgi:ArsR family transcriptional regulator, arsenate/arsenite/antimonite-responsive transcriptional repressor
MPVEATMPNPISIGIELLLDASPVPLHHPSMRVEQASRQLEALGNTTRLNIYRALVRAGPNGLLVGQIQERIGIPASTLSHHVRRLVETGLVTQERQATALICRAHYPAMHALLGFLSDECCAEEACGTSPPQEIA